MLEHEILSNRKPARATTSIMSAVFRPVIERRAVYIVHTTETAWLKFQETVLRYEIKLTYPSVCRKKFVYTWLLE